MAKERKVRVDLRKNRTKPPRQNDLTRGYDAASFDQDATVADERVRAKGDLSRRRTITVREGEGASAGGAPAESMPAVDTAVALPGRVLRVHGLETVVETEDGRTFRCRVRRLLKSLQTDERNIVTCGDRVWFRPAGGDEGLIERVEPRHGALRRASRRREHVVVANVDQLLIVMSLFEPDLKPHLIDRYTAVAFQGGLKPVVCLNKADLADPAAFQALVGSYAQLGIPALLTSATTGLGIDRLRGLLAGRATVLSGQSGVGKSSLLNAVQPGLALKVRSVSEATQKGRHTTTTAELIRLDFGGWVVDTPGVRQLALWNLPPGEVEGFFPEFRPYVPLCGFPDCTHTHEANCAVKRAVDRRQSSARRYTSYLGMFAGTLEE
jgi:ribosome biogenesis GTPase / thiamine phosphate phosphatase